MTPSVFSSVLWSLCRTWGGRLAGFVIYFQLVRVLTPVEMGLFSAAFAVFVFFEIFVDQGMVQAVVQRPCITPGQLNAVLILNMLSALLLVVLLCVSAEWIESLLGVPQLAQIIQVGSITLLFASAGFSQEAMARREFRFKRLALRTLLSTIAGGAVGVYLAATGYGVWALVTQMLVSAALNLLFLWLKPAWPLLVKPDFHGVGALSRFGLQVTGMRLIEFGGTRGMELLIASLMGVSALGLYAVGTKIHYIFVQLLGLALSDVAHSGFARMADDRQRLRNAYLSSIGSVALVSTPVWVILSAAAPEVAHIAFGPAWQGSAQVLAPFALLGALQVLQKFDTAVLNALGRPVLSVVLSTARAALALLSVWAFHGRGLQAVVMAFVLTQFLVTPLNMWLLRRTVGIEVREWLRQLWPPLLAGTAAWAAIASCREADVLAQWLPLTRFLALASLGSAVYALLLALFARDRVHGLFFRMRALKKS